MLSFWSEIKDTLSNGMGTVIMTIMLAFIIVLVFEFINGSRKTSFRELFIDERSGKFSHTKYWSNVAYLVATVVFLYMHMFMLDKITNQLEILWLIYLGVVAGNASMNKLISYKYGAMSKNQNNPYGHQSYPYQDAYYQTPTRQRRRMPPPDNPELDGTDSYDVGGKH